MNRAWTEDHHHPDGHHPEGYRPDGRRSPIQEILATRESAVARAEAFASRYGEGRREQKERDQIRESYLAIDVRFKDGSMRGFFYFDLAGSPTLDASQTVLRVPFREEVLVIHGYRLYELYRAILHHSLDVLEVTHRPEFASGDGPVIASVEITDRKGEL